jgi:hypothetical protein
MARPEGEGSNSIWVILTEWDNILKHTSLAWQVPENANDIAKPLPQINAPTPATKSIDINLSTRRASLIRKRKSESCNG